MAIPDTVDIGKDRDAERKKTVNSQDGEAKEDWPK